MLFIRNNGLTIVLMLIFISSAIGMALSGHSAFNAEQAEHSAAAVPLTEYISSSRFFSALFENWESEFLQMAFYVILTAYLFQRGSAESRDPDDPERPKDSSTAVSWLYAHSLGLALLALFAVSFVLNWLASAADAAHDATLHSRSSGSLFEHLGEAQFWFEFFQNWQSEFLSTSVLVVLSIFLRYPDLQSQNLCWLRTVTLDRDFLDVMRLVASMMPPNAFVSQLGAHGLMERGAFTEGSVVRF